MKANLEQKNIVLINTVWQQTHNGGLKRKFDLGSESSEWVTFCRLTTKSDSFVLFFNLENHNETEKWYDKILFMY